MGFNKERILIVTAVPAEKDAVSRGLDSKKVDVRAAGIGPAAAASETARALATGEYGLVISTGIAGAFSGRAELGSLVVASEIIAADLGVETPEGFSSLDELGYGSCKIQADAGLVSQVAKRLVEARLPVRTGPIITVSTATGTSVTAAEMLRRVPEAVAEGMEGHGVALAAYNFGVPVLEIRSISNQVGPRDRNKWRIKEAFGALEKAFSVLTEVLS